MKILLLTNRIPYPLNDGGAIGMDYFVSGYQNTGAKVYMLSLNTSKHFVNTEALPAYYKQLAYFDSVYVNNHVKAIPAFLNLFSTQSYHVTRFYTRDYELKLIALLQKETFDVIHLDSIFLAFYLKSLRQFSNAKIVCRIHNVEHKIWERLALNAGFLPKKWYLNLLAKRLKKTEIATLNAVDLLLTIAPEDNSDLKQIGVTTPTLLVPFGISISNTVSVFCHTPTCFHIGSMDWMPNKEGINWFLTAVWPILHKEAPEIECHLAGKKMKPEDYPKLEGVHYHGEVGNAKAFIEHHNVMIVPVLSGDGIRVKILEALASGKKIVSTTLGARGIRAKYGQDIFIADTPSDFAACIKKAINSDTTMNQNARKLIEEQYHKERIFEQTVHFYKNDLNN